MNFWTNVRSLLEKRGRSIRSLAGEIGVTPGALSHYSRGAVPGLDVAIRIAEALDVSLDALVWGNEGTTLLPLCKAPEEHVLLRELLEEFGLQEAILLSRLTMQGLAWRIAQVLLEALPHALSQDSLREAVESPNEEIFRASLLVLKRKKIIEELDAGGNIEYRFRRGVARFEIRELGDRTWHTKLAVRLLFAKVLPRLLEQDDTAHLTTITAKVPRAMGERISGDLDTLVKERSAEVVGVDGDTEISVIFAVALEDEVG